MSAEFEADLCPQTGWPRVRFNFGNGWSASVVLRTGQRTPTIALQASLACCPTGEWGTGATELGETEATADEAAAYLAQVAARPAP